MPAHYDSVRRGLQPASNFARRRVTALLWAALLLGATSPAICWSQELTAVEAQEIAREAYIYGFPLVENYKRVHADVLSGEQATETPFNTIKHRDYSFVPGDTRFDTPNIDTPYSLMWMDLRSEPLVLGVPPIEGDRYFAIQLIDLYSYSFDYIGSRATGNGGGAFLIAGPRWNGEPPAGIDKVIHCETEFAHAVYRTEQRGPGDLDAVKEIQSKYTVQRLSNFVGEPAPDPSEATEFPAPKTEAQPDLSFFSTCSFVMQFCAAPQSDDELLSRLARIGVKPGESFEASSLSEEIQSALQVGIDEGVEAIASAASSLKVAEVVGTRDYLGADYLKRAVGARLGHYVNSKEEALYPLYLSDAEGEPLDANSARYTLRLAPGELPPVEALWSITMYGGQDKSLVPNSLGRYQISSAILPELLRDADGGVTLYIQHESPTDDQSANWLPAPDGPFYMVMRLFWPKPEAFDGTWTPPLVWRVDSEQRPKVEKPAGAEGAEEVKPSVLIDEPKPEMERPTIWGEPTEVQITIYVIDVDEVNSADQSFASSVYVKAVWKNPFLRHKGPGPMNRALTDVWNPRLTIIGQQAAWKSYPESVEIEPDGTVTYRQKIWGRFSQPLALRDFPFDQQELSIHLVAAGLLEEHVSMVSSDDGGRPSSNIATRFSLPDFDVVSWNSSPTPYFATEGEPGIAGYEMSIRVDRQATYYVLKVIIPLCLIVVMSWLPRWIDPEQSGTNIGISTSAFLTLVAYLFAITVLLPKVSYITRMDRFILLSTLTVFAGLIQTVANIVLIRAKRKSTAEFLDRWSRALYPLLLAIVIGISFLL